MYRTTKLLSCVMLLVWITGSFLPASGNQAEKIIDEWIEESILRISQRARDIVDEHDDPYFVPRVLVGPIVTRVLPQKEFYESQFSLLLRDAIYLKLSAGLAPIRMEIIDTDILPKAVKLSGLNSPAKLNISNVAASYAQDEAMRQCISDLLNVADMVVLGQITLKGTEALTTFTILTMKDVQLYLDHTPISIQTLQNVPDISKIIEKSGIDRMIAFVASTDDEIQKSVETFVEQYASTWEKGDVDKMMSYYDKNASAVTLIVNDKSSVELTNVLDRNALELVMVEFFERYRVTNFDFSKTSVYDVKWNSSNVVSCSVDFYADITLSDGKTRRLPLLSFYMQLRREGGKDWRIYFQRIKEVPKYSVQLLGN